MIQRGYLYIRQHLYFQLPELVNADGVYEKLLKFLNREVFTGRFMILKELEIFNSQAVCTTGMNGVDVEISEPVNADGVDNEILKFLENTSLQSIPFNNLQIIKEIGKESGAIHPQAIYTSRFVSLKELMVINSLAVCTNGIINDDNIIVESQENTQIIESQEDNIPIERMNKIMLEIEKTKAASVRLSLCE
ncbi:hypothetical protein F8M41_019329 [Gigaspora margarita]|uniref:Uncharacterized protein n=1 Tax=Gigaspora margarita TaxID=4874 RepID=A0A8H4AK70_GIGMA|nr:hypothetical protein F8M41_019329 [Gigaspora margarita]